MIGPRPQKPETDTPRAPPPKGWCATPARPQAAVGGKSPMRAKSAQFITAGLGALLAVAVALLCFSVGGYIWLFSGDENKQIAVILALFGAGLIFMMIAGIVEPFSEPPRSDGTRHFRHKKSE